MRNDRHLVLGVGEIEVDRNEALPRTRLQVLQHALVAGVVRDDQLESGGCDHRLAGLVDRQDPAVVGERMQHHDGVGTCLDELVQIADCAFAHGARERSVLPEGSVMPHEEASHQVAGAEVVVAGNRDQRTTQPPRHVLDETRLAAACRSLEHHGVTVRVAVLEDLDLVTERHVIRRLKRPGVVMNGAFGATPS